MNVWTLSFCIEPDTAECQWRIFGRHSFPAYLSNIEELIERRKLLLEIARDSR